MSLTARERVQRAYPRIYLACHTRHVRARSTTERLSARDSTILAHLDRTHPVTAGDLAGHLAVGKSTLSAALSRLVRLGYVTRTVVPSNRRLAHLRLSESGARAMAATSTLDPDRLDFLLSQLTPADRRAAVRGLELLAGAAARTIAHFRDQDR